MSFCCFFLYKISCFSAVLSLPLLKSVPEVWDIKCPGGLGHKVSRRSGTLYVPEAWDAVPGFGDTVFYEGFMSQTSGTPCFTCPGALGRCPRARGLAIYVSRCSGTESVPDPWDRKCQSVPDPWDRKCMCAAVVCLWVAPARNKQLPLEPRCQDATARGLRRR